jgi:hypothetical protein
MGTHGEHGRVERRESLDLCDHLTRMRIFILMMNKILTWTHVITRKMTRDMIWILSTNCMLHILREVVQTKNVRLRPTYH